MDSNLVKSDSQMKQLDEMLDMIIHCAVLSTSLVYLNKGIKRHLVFTSKGAI